MILEFRSLAAALMLMAFAVNLPAQVDDEGADSTFRVEEASVHVGRVIAGNDITGTFVFHNDSDKEVKIIRAKPS